MVDFLTMTLGQFEDYANNIAQLSGEERREEFVSRAFSCFHSN